MRLVDRADVFEMQTFVIEMLQDGRQEAGVVAVMLRFEVCNIIFVRFIASAILRKLYRRRVGECDQVFDAIFLRFFGKP
ncbi:hypothetical protein D3C86_2054940 [compost metagenome]